MPRACRLGPRAGIREAKAPDRRGKKLRGCLAIWNYWSYITAKTLANRTKLEPSKLTFEISGAVTF